MEPGGDLLLGAGVRQHVACDLLDGKLLERHIFVQRLDDPVAILPRRSQIILFVTVRVRVAREV